MDVRMIPEGTPCKHPGCLSHVSHPCEGCGRIAGSYFKRATEEGISKIGLTEVEYKRKYEGSWEVQGNKSPARQDRQ